MLHFDKGSRLLEAAAIARKVSLIGERYLSPDFLRRKVHEKGLAWCIKAGTRRALRIPVSVEELPIGQASRALLGPIAWLSLLAVISPAALLLVAARVRFLDTEDLTRIGHLVKHPELYVKSRLVNWRPWYFGVLLAPAVQVVNPRMLDYWRPHIKVVSHPVLVALLQSFLRFAFLQYEKSKLTLPDGSAKNSNEARFRIQVEYEARYGSQPLLTLLRSDHERGWSCLRELGVPRDAWFVCLHAREGGFLPSLTHHSYRDVDISTYLLAVQGIVEQGGWVIRMGDPTMKPLPAMDQVVDYVHSAVRSDWMDVFCLASCRFCLGSDSGIITISQVFGVPTARANWSSIGHGPHSGSDLWIPKLFHSVDENRYLTFEEILLSPLRRLARTEDFEAAGITVVDNSPREIRDLNVEMMERLDGTAHYTAEDEQLQSRFKSLFEAEPMNGTNARVGRDFLRQHRDLLD